MMEINGLPVGEQVKKAKSARLSDTIAHARQSADSHLRKDTVQIHSAGSANIVLDSIRAKINKGFYNSDAVADDISDKLARLFDR